MCRDAHMLRPISPMLRGPSVGRLGGLHTHTHGWPEKLEGAQPRPATQVRCCASGAGPRTMSTPTRTEKSALAAQPPPASVQ